MILSPRWRKVFRDLWDNKARTILVVLAIAVGVFSFGSAFITQDVLLADMNAQYRGANTASIVLSASDFDEGLVRWVRNRQQVADAQGRAVYLVQLVTTSESVTLLDRILAPVVKLQERTGIKIVPPALGPEGASETKHNLNLVAVSNDVYDDMRINRIAPEEGSWPPGRREILLERSSVALAGADIGDTILIELSDGRQRELAFTGTVHDLNAVPANLFPQLSGYVTFETLAWLGYPNTYTELLVVDEGGLTDTAELATVADEVNEELRRQKVTINSITVQDPSKHWGADVTQGFTLVLSGVGIFSLILSGFLVVNTITGVLAQQKRQIGMMKAIGGTGGQIIAVYMVMVATFGILALLVALPVGAALAYASTLSVTNFLNVDILDFHIPPRVFVMETAAALFAPLVAALVPIVNGTRVTAREAISDYGLGTRRRRSLIDILLARLRGLPRPVLLSLRNTFRRKGRLFLTLGTLTLAGALFISVVNVRGALMDELFDILGVYNYDIAIILDDDYLSEGVERRVSRVPGVTRVQGMAYSVGKRVRPDGVKGPSFEWLGVSPATSLLQPTVIDGRWLEPGDWNAIVVSTDWLNDEPDVGVGDTVTLEARNKKWECEIVGVYLLPGDPTVYGSFDFVSRVQDAPGLTSFLLVETETRSGEFQDMVKEELEEQLKGGGIGVSQTITRELIVGSAVSQFDFLVYFLLATATLVAIVGGLGLAGTMSLNVLERTREIGVMRAIGASNGSVRSIILVEGVLIGLLSWMLATPLSMVMSIGFSAALGTAIFQHPMPANFSILGIGIWLLIAVVISAVASLLPANSAARVTVRDALAYE